MEEQPQSGNEQEFVKNIDALITDFLSSNEEMIELEPMNGYYRRLAHKIGGLFKLNSHSVGEQDERFVCLIRTKESCIPDNKSQLLAEILDEGKPQHSERPRRDFSSSERPRRDAPSSERPRRDTPRYDMGGQLFATKPGTRIILRQDGSFGVAFNNEKDDFIMERVVENGKFMIRNSKIVCPGDDNET